MTTMRREKSMRPMLVLTALAALTIACGAGTSTSSGGTPTAPATPTSGKNAPITPTTPRTTPPATPAVPQITDGTWTVGEDFPAGTYKTVNSSADCYWAITKTGSNGSDIVNNHIGGGNLRVTLKAGQDFETQRCGTWTKV